MKQSRPFMKGTLILTCAGLFSRLIGFYNRVFLASCIGAHQLGIYQLIFPIYLVGFSFCVQGFTTALSKMAADRLARSLHMESKKILKITVLFTLGLSCVFSSVVFFNASWIAETFLKEPDCAICLKWAVFALPFVGIKGCIHSYALGISKPGLPAASMCFEQIVRVISIYVLSVTCLSLVPTAALIPVIGMIIGELASFVMTLLSFFSSGKCQRKSPLPCSTVFIFKELCHLGIPLTLNSLSVTLLQSTESILIPVMLARFYTSRHYAVILYGIVTGMALPFITFPGTITRSLSVMLLPKVSSAYAQKNSRALWRSSKASLLFCLLLGIGSFMFFFFFGETIGTLVFHTKKAGLFLKHLSFLCPFLYLSGTLQSILNGLGKTRTTLIHNCAAMILRIGAILFLIPLTGIRGYFIGLTASSILLVLLNFSSVKTALAAAFHG